MVEAKMINLTINGIEISAPEGTTILEAAEDHGISIPHLCWLRKINEIGACRVCCVEVLGEPKLVPSCITKIQEGMVVVTNSVRVRAAARTNLQFIMSQHNSSCTQCTRSGNCRLQTLCNDLNIDMEGFYMDIPEGKRTFWPKEFPLQRDATKCIKCMRCIQTCDQIQNIHVWDLLGSGAWTRVDVRDNMDVREADCTLCSQCIVNCPTAALSERSDILPVMKLINDPDIITIAQIAPAIRTAWGEGFGLSASEATAEKLAAVLKACGFDYVFDTSFGADLTIMEEASEFLERFGKGDFKKYPMFTSCCPGWVRFIKTKYPELVENLSTSKSPHEMFGAVIKSYFAERIGVDPKKIRTVSIMPCVAKKAEAALPTMAAVDGLQDVDYVLTTREMIRMIRSTNIQVERMAEIPFDNLMADYTGAGVIFGVTGGVMEAALRSAAYFATGEKPDVDAFRPIRSSNKIETHWKEMEVDVAGNTLRIAVVSGLNNTDLLCTAIVRGDVKYDFVEVMACPNGCAGGGGQPVHQDDIDRRKPRGEVLHRIDEKQPIR